MDRQGYDNQAAGGDLQSNNPFQQSNEAANAWQDQPSSGGPHSAYQAYSAPPGPPPGQQPIGQAPARSDTFKETDYVPESERGEQREAMEQFEMSKPQSDEDRDLETLQREFPSVDGSLVAALYGDSKSLSGTREMLKELASGQQ